MDSLVLTQNIMLTVSTDHLADTFTFHINKWLNHNNVGLCRLKWPLHQVNVQVNVGGKSCRLPNLRLNVWFPPSLFEFYKQYRNICRGNLLDWLFDWCVAVLKYFVSPSSSRHIWSFWHQISSLGLYSRIFYRNCGVIADDVLNQIFTSNRSVIVFSSAIWFHYSSDDQIIIRPSNRIAA